MRNSRSRRHPIKVKEILQSVLDRDDFVVVDPHVHITSHDVQESPVKALRQTMNVSKARGVDLLVETEHNKTPDCLHKKCIVPGVELHTFLGHVNIVGAAPERIEQALLEYQGLLYVSRRLPIMNQGGSRKRSSKKSSRQQPRLNLGRVVHDFIDNPDSIIVLPHSFNGGGVFYDKPTAAYSKLNRRGTYFIEWTNGRRSPDSRQAQNIISVVRGNNNFFLFAGSDTHGKKHVGLAGIAVFSADKTFPSVREQLLSGNYKCYHIQFRNGATELMIMDGTAENMEYFSLRYKKGEWTARDISKRVRLNYTPPKLFLPSARPQLSKK